MCSTSSTEAVIKFIGLPTGAEANTFEYYVYAPVSSGEDITLYPPATTYNVEPNERFEDSDGAAVSPTKYDFVLVELKPAKRGASGLEAQSDAITVTGKPGEKKVVYIYRDEAPDDVEAVPNRPTGSTAEGLPSDPDITLTITFLGTPAVGKDGGDRNKIIEDFQQCIENPDDADTDFETGTTNQEACNDIVSGSGGAEKILRMPLSMATTYCRPLSRHDHLLECEYTGRLPVTPVAWAVRATNTSQLAWTGEDSNGLFYPVVTMSKPLTLWQTLDVNVTIAS